MGKRNYWMGKPLIPELFCGRTGLLEGDAETISEVALFGRTYVEIGTLFGGSACLAGLAGCEVFCIDPLDGYYASGQADTTTGILPTPEIVRDNWVNHGLDPTRLHLYTQLHPPWPKEIDRTFDVGFIDGDHSYEGVMEDYLGMKDRVIYLMLDDTNKSSVKAVWNIAIESRKWREYIPKTRNEHTIRVLERSEQ